MLTEILKGEITEKNACICCLYVCGGDGGERKQMCRLRLIGLINLGFFFLYVFKGMKTLS